MAQLTPREQDILRLVAEGKANKQIAYELHLKLQTVRNHLQNIFDKLGVDNRTAAAVKFLQLK